ncbi:acVLRF1 family peptidyl-tRNA hydrolase [Actinomadura sp. DC4]|uniref:acVLRF1 family peptidyl-tRNA hydrolase n=1 Tax=Actinomadura sp. DC4 TaxID=3055069 RepID=UPI0025B0E09F|nr:acVLRF1 family peptidyl-tRNA hydrolase [Actinomadura sp. DC4]MDN3355357.1 acVLRF1 family peptidyl-tRNA hydrolase [Actinomadura sp. DC4]
MAKPRPAAGGGRWVEVPPDRLGRWLDGFADRHEGFSAVAGPRVVVLRGGDGALAECHVPFPPLDGDLIGHVLRDRRVGVLLVRLGGYACGVFDGDRLGDSKVGARLVHGRSAAGGQSQQRFARRRDGQAREALRAAADTAARVLAPQAAGLAAFVCGGDRRAVDALRGDRHLGALFALETGPFLTVPDPRLAVLRETPRTFRAVRVRLTEPG